MFSQFTYWLSAAISISLFIWYCRSKYFTIVGPVFWYFIFHMLVFVVRPLGVIYGGFGTVFDYMKFSPTDDDKAMTFIVAIVGLLVFLPCAFWGGAGDRWSFADIPQVRRRVWVQVLVGALCLSPWILYSVYISMSGQVQGERIGGTYILTNTTGYVIDAQGMLLPFGLIIIVISRFRWWSYIPIGIYFTFVTIYERTRWQLVVGSLALYLLYCVFRARRIKKLPVVIVLPIILILFALKGLNREIYMELLLLHDTTGLNNITKGMTLRDQLDTQDFANYEYLTYIVHMVPRETHTYLYFSQWLQIFTEPIPRILWPEDLWGGKPVGAPLASHFFDLNDYGNFIGLTPSLLGDGWLSLGWVGEIITVGISSYILGRLHRYACTQTSRPLFCIGYCILIALLFQFFRDGGISIFKFVMFALAPVWILAYFE